jgi:TetR/AcrR family transcriptional repressor of nem operon
MMSVIIIVQAGFVKSEIKMRISKAQAQANRDKVVGAASALFRAQGFETVTVNEVMAAAGFTHGGFYNHFASKEALAAEALASAWDDMAAERERAGDLKTLLPLYLSRASRRAPGRSCPAAALGGDVGRAPGPVRAVFADGLEGMIRQIEAGLPEVDDGSNRARAVNLVAKMVGALMLSRAVPDDSPLAGELLEAVLKAALAEVG